MGATVSAGAVWVESGVVGSWANATAQKKIAARERMILCIMRGKDDLVLLNMRILFYCCIMRTK